MDRESIIKEVINTEQEIGRLIAGFSPDSGDIARIDIDLALEKIRRLYDMVLKLEGGDFTSDNVKPEKENTPQEPNVSEEKEPLQPEIKVDEPENVSFEKKDEINTEEKTIEQEEVAAKEPQQTKDLFETETAQDKKPAEPGQPKKEESVPAGVTMDLFGETIADKIAPETDKTIADSISEKVTEKSVADVIQKTKIEDLKQAIGINEKFFFINELFDGNMKDYNETIDTLNGFNSKNEAIDYFNDLKSKNRWKDDNEAVIQLTELIGRRYEDY
jgi:hypothetical protein